MARYRIQHRTATALLLVALASCGLTACGGSSPASPTPPLTPQQVAERHAEIVEFIGCTRRHGVHLPPPTATGVNVGGIKDRRRAKIVSACYQKVTKKAERQARAEQARQGSSRLGEESSSG